MEHFVYVVMEKNNSLNESLDESIFPGSELYETAHGASVYQIPLPRQLTNEEADEYAHNLANYMFECGCDDFDIEFPVDEEVVEEITLDGDDFYEEFGDMWFNEDDELDEAEYQGRKVSLGKPMQVAKGNASRKPAWSVLVIVRFMVTALTPVVGTSSSPATTRLSVRSAPMPCDRHGALFDRLSASRCGSSGT